MPVGQVFHDKDIYVINDRHIIVAVLYDMTRTYGTVRYDDITFEDIKKLGFFIRGSIGHAIKFGAALCVK